MHIQTTFGKIVIEGESAPDVLKTLETISPQFLSNVEKIIQGKIAPSIELELNGIVEITTEGPIIATQRKLTHYEAIGLVLYACKGKSSTATQISRLLAASGIKSMVPARLNEMTKRGLVFKPDPARPKIRLTASGERWIEEELLKKLQIKQME